MRKFIFVTCLSGCLFLVAHLAPLLVVDPINISKLELSDNEFYIREMRFQSAGIINKIKFDSVIIGSSMAENFLPETTSKILGGHFQNLSLSGSLLSERKVVLDYFFSQQNVSTVLISMDGITSVQRNSGIPLDAWSHLYNDNHYDDYLVYLTRKFSPYINCHTSFDNAITSLVFGACPKEKIRLSVEALTEWQSDPQHNSRFGGIDLWIAHNDNQQVNASVKRIKQSVKPTFDKPNDLLLNLKNPIYDAEEFIKNISPLIRQQSSSRFILFFPPYSTFHHAVTKRLEPNVYQQYVEMVKALVVETEQYPNAELYWFQNEDFANDIANYKDLTHYHQNINTLMLEKISQGQARITSDNYLDLLDIFEKQVAEVDLLKLAKALNQGDQLSD